MLEPQFTPFPTLHTQRLILRRMVIEDTPEILFLRSNENVMKYIDKKRAATIEDAEEWLRMIDDALELNNGITWAISLKESPRVMLGSIGYWRIIKEHYRAEIGYMLNHEYWRKGIMKEALLRVIDFGFDELKLHSIEANINTGNVASSRILLNTGFVQEAYFKEDFFFEGTFRDTIIYSKLSTS